MGSTVPFLWVRHRLSPEPITIMLAAGWLSKGFLVFTQPTLCRYVCTRLMLSQAHSVCTVTCHGGAVSQPVKVLQLCSPPTHSSSACKARFLDQADTDPDLLAPPGPRPPEEQLQAGAHLIHLVPFKGRALGSPGSSRSSGEETTVGRSPSVTPPPIHTGL